MKKWFCGMFLFIYESKLTEREKSLLAASNYVFFVFDYIVDSEYDEVSV